MAIVPNTVELERYEAAEPARAPATVMYPGAFGYPPNQLAARRLIEEIFPTLAGLRPDVRLQLVGSE